MVDREGRLLDLGREVDLWSLGALSSRFPLSLSSSLTSGFEPARLFAGMVLYKLLFFKLPYSQIEDFDRQLAASLRNPASFHR
jgi:hypothetical protein